MTLQNQNTESALFQLKQGVLPFYQKAFLIPKAHKTTLIKGEEKQSKFNVIELQLESNELLIHP